MNEICFKIISNVGNKRAVNEDSVWPGMNIKTHPFANSKYGQLFIIADGMGGHGAGDIASKIAVNTTQRVYYDPQLEHANPKERLEWAIQMAHREITLKSNTEATKRMGTTLVAAVIKDSQLWCAWVGDSRLYILRDGKLQQLTQDHAELWEEYRTGQISWEAIHYHPRRSKLTNSITKRRKNLEVSHLVPMSLFPGDRVLLCSDGLSSEVKDNEIEKILAHNPLEKAATKLVKAAKSPKKWVTANGQKVPSEGGEDNVTIVLIEMPGGRFTSFPGTFAKTRIILTLLILLIGVTVGAIQIFRSAHINTSTGQQTNLNTDRGILPIIQLGNSRPTEPTPSVTASGSSVELPVPKEMSEPVAQTPGIAAATSTLAPFPTPPPVPTPTNTSVVPTATPTVVASKDIEVQSPANEFSVSTNVEVTFEWKWNGCEPPPDNYFFDIVETNGNGLFDISEIKRDATCDDKTQIWSYRRRLPAGNYEWKIIIAQVNPYKGYSQFGQSKNSYKLVVTNNRPASNQSTTGDENAPPENN